MVGPTERNGAEHFSPDLTVVLPVRNEAPHLLEVLGDLTAQSLDPARYEIVVADGRSDDRTRELVEEFAVDHSGVRLVDNPAGLSSSARNAGINAARGRYVLFVDGHCRVPSRLMLEEVLKTFESGARCISRPQPLVPSADTTVAEAIVQTRSSVLGHLPGSMIYSEEDLQADPTSAGCGYSRDLIAEIGLFDTAFDAAEDVEFNSRVQCAGVVAVHSGRFAVEYLARPTWPSLARQMYRYGLGRARLFRKSGFVSGVGPAALPAALLVAAVLGIAMVPFVDWMWTALTMLALAGAAVALVCGILVGSKGGPIVGLLSVPTLGAILAGAASGFLAGLFAGPPDGDPAR